MNRHQIEKCPEWGHEYHFNLNIQEDFKVKPRCLPYQKQILIKLITKSERIINEINRTTKCTICIKFIKDTLKYFEYVKNNLDNEGVRIDFEQLIHNITLSPNRKYIKSRTKFRGIE